MPLIKAEVDCDFHSVKVMIQVNVVKHLITLLVLLERTDHSWLELSTTLRSMRKSEIS